MAKKTAKINKVVGLLTISDIFTWGPLIVISSLSGVYLAKRLGGDIVEYVGIGTGIYYITRALFQVPIGALTDKLKKDKDEILILILGTLLTGLAFILYTLVTEPIHYYFAQFIFGLGISLNIVNWRKLFAINVTSGMEGKQYAIYDTVLSVATAILSVVIGFVANIGDKYFDIVMIASGSTMMLAGVWIALILKVKDRKSNKINK
jgi:MFS family permease